MDIEDADFAQSAAAEHPTIDDTTVPSLKSVCVKVIGMHLNSIDSFGSMPWHIIKLVLEDKRCTPEILRRLENSSPHLKEQDQDIWKKFFFEKYPEKLDAFQSGEFAGTANWRRLYDESARNDEDKLALAALRLREAKERKTAEKRERELQRTDKAPPSKRARWGESIPTRPKSLLEKARSQTMKATAVYRKGPSSSPIPSPASSSSLARGSVSVKPPAVVRRLSTASTISTASSSTAVSNVSSISSSRTTTASLGSRIPSTPPLLQSPSKSSTLASGDTRPLAASSASTPKGRLQPPARSVTLPNSRTPSFSPPAPSSITRQPRLGTSNQSVEPSASQTPSNPQPPHTSMADLIFARSRASGSR